MFTDEYDQTYLVPRLRDDVVIDALVATPNLKTYIFADSTSAWQNYAQETGGRMFDLSSNQQQMYDDLMSILDEICLSSSQQQEAFRNLPSGFFPASTLWYPRYNYKIGICY